MKSLSLILLLLFSFSALSQQNNFLEGLSITENTEKSSARDIDLLNERIKDSIYSNAKAAVKYAKLAHKISKNVEYAQGEVEALMNLSRAMVYSNELDSSLLFSELAVTVSERIQSDELKIKSHELLGGILTHRGEYDKAADEYFLTIKLAEKYDEEMAITSYANLGHLFKMVGNVDKSRQYSKEGYNLGKKYKDTAVMITSLNILGLLDKNEENNASALKYFEEGLAYSRETNNLERQSQILYNMANVYFNDKRYDEGFVLYNESMEISKVNDSYTMVAIGFHGGALTYLEIGRMREATSYADSALHYALLSNNYEIVMESYALQAEVHKVKGNHAKSLEFLELAYIYKDSLNLSQLNASALEAESNFEREREHIADSLEQVKNDLKIAHDKKIDAQKIRSQQILLWISGIILIIIFFFIYMLVKSLRTIKVKNQLVSEQNKEIQIQHKEITDSINYAQRIQEAIIAKEAEWQKVSSQHYIFFKPKDVVSGDFYWAYHDVDKNISTWAVADCTGHGVPGAFMSMLGIGFLNEIVIENRISNPGDILDHLRAKIIGALNREKGEKSKDGMDISLCVWNKTTNELQYAGANNPLWIIRKGELENDTAIKRSTTYTDNWKLHEIAPDKMPIGNFLSIPPPFSTKKVYLQKGDTVVLITDGFADQFGGDQGKKFKYSPLKELLVDLEEVPHSDCSVKLDNHFQAWRGSEDQVDDVCIVGVKI